MNENFELAAISEKIYEYITKAIIGEQPIQALIENSTFIPKEGWLWDYKENYNSDNNGIAKTILQILSFHNTYGGYIIYGVKEFVKDTDFRPLNLDFSDFKVAQIRDKIKEYTGCLVDITFKEIKVNLSDKIYNMGIILIPKRSRKVKPISFIKNGPQLNNKSVFSKNDTYLRVLDECKKANTPDDWQLLFSERNYTFIDQMNVSFQNKQYFEHNLPSRSLICNNFVGREELLGELWEWLNDDFEFVKILSGDGGKGKTSIAYEFCKTFIETPPIEFERILWLSVKEQQFSGIDNSYYEIQDADFSDTISFLICLAEHSTLNISDYEDIAEKVIKKDLRDALPHFPSLIVVDDIDSLKDDDQKKVVDICRQLGSSFVRFLITTRKKLAYSSDLCIDVPGLPIDEFAIYINTICVKFKLNELDSKKLRKLHESCDGSPLLSASILRLYKQGIEFNTAIKQWSGQAGEDARNAALKREIDSLSSNAKRILLIIFYFKSCSFTELKQIAGIAETRLVEYLEELQSLFLVDEPKIINSEERFSVSNTTTLIVSANVKDLAHDYQRLNQSIKALRTQSGDRKKGNRFKVGAAIRQALALLKDERVPEAIDTITKELVSFPDNPDLILMKARCLIYTEKPDYEKIRNFIKISIGKGQRKEIAYQLWYDVEQKLESANGIIEVSLSATEVDEFNKKNWYERLSNGYLLRSKFRDGQAFLKDLNDASEALSKVLKLANISEKEIVKDQLYKLHDKIWYRLERDNEYGWLNVFDMVFSLIKRGDARTLMFQRCCRCLIEVNSEGKLSDKKEIAYEARKNKFISFLNTRSNKDKVDRPFDDLMESLEYRNE